MSKDAISIQIYSPSVPGVLPAAKTGWIQHCVSDLVMCGSCGLLWMGPPTPGPARPHPSPVVAATEASGINVSINKMQCRVCSNCLVLVVAHSGCKHSGLGSRCQLIRSNIQNVTEAAVVLGTGGNALHTHLLYHVRVCARTHARTCFGLLRICHVHTTQFRVQSNLHRPGHTRSDQAAKLPSFPPPDRYV